MGTARDPIDTDPARTWVWPAGAAVLATAAIILTVSLFVGPAGIAGGRQPDREPGDRSPVLVRAWFVGRTADGPRLFAEHREFGGRPDALAWSLQSVVAGTALDPDYSSPWPRGAGVSDAHRRDEMLVVDLAGPVVRRPASMDRTTAQIALQQVVRTAQDVSGSRVPVTFRLGGRAASVVLGLDTSAPLDRAADDTVLAPVSISSPVDQSFVGDPFTVRGRASTGAARVRWELRQAGGVVRRGTASTAGCCTRAPYSFTVTAPPGTYTLVVHDQSDRASSDSKQVRIS